MTKTTNLQCLPKQDEDKFIKMIYALDKIRIAFRDLNENLKNFSFCLEELQEIKRGLKYRCN